MKLAELSIRRHVLAYMLSAVLVLFGLIAYQKIGVDRYPNIEQPVISISTTLTGATPEVMDSSVTQIIEAAVNSVPGIDSIESTSQPGRSTVKVTFNLDKNIDVAFNEVQVRSTRRSAGCRMMWTCRWCPRPTPTAARLSGWR
jgi:HAE1 family hydrophobic/amphiphilic exporter-1